MKILMLSPTLPWPLNMGSKIRIYHILRQLARTGHEVTLLSLSQEPFSKVELEALRPHCAGLKVVQGENRAPARAALRALLSNKSYRVAKFESAEFKDEVAQTLMNDYDILWVHFLETLAYAPQHPTEGKRPLVVLDQHNADERFWETYVHQGPLWIRFFALQNLWKLRRFQRLVLQIVDAIMSVSEKDAEFTRTHLSSPATEVLVVPNGVDTEGLQPADDSKHENRIIFCGAMDVLMNIDAVERFVQAIFPKVIQAVPEAEFWIVGRDPVRRVRALEAISGVRVTGRVEDVRPYYAKAKVAVASFRYGGGTKLKVLEAMTLGVPVVATPVGCQGIEAVPGKHLFVEEGSGAFAQRVIALLQDKALREKIAAEARRLVEQQYSWEGVLREPIARLQVLVEQRATK